MAEDAAKSFDLGSPRIDPLTLDDLRAAGLCAVLFERAGTPLQLWEAFTLLKTNRGLVLKELLRLSRGGGDASRVQESLLAKLEELRRELEPTAKGVRDFLAQGQVQIEEARREQILVFIMGAARARQAAASWLADPERTATEAQVRLRILGSVVEAYRNALRVAPPLTLDEVERWIGEEVSAARHRG